MRVKLSEKLVGLYRNREWDAAEACLHEALAVAPDDKIAAIYLERIAAFRATPPAENWDGAIELEKL